MHMIYVVAFFMPCVRIFSKWSSINWELQLTTKKDKHAFGTSYTRKYLHDFCSKIKFGLNIYMLITKKKSSLFLEKEKLVVTRWA